MCRRWRCSIPAFHATLPPSAFLYGLPLEFYTEQGIRRYGLSRHLARLRDSAGGGAFGGVARGPPPRLAAFGQRLERGGGGGGAFGGYEHGLYAPLGPAHGHAHRAISTPACSSTFYKTGWRRASSTRSSTNARGFWGLSGVSNDMRDVRRAARSGKQSGAGGRWRFSVTASAKSSALTRRRWAASTR